MDISVESNFKHRSISSHQKYVLQRFRFSIFHFRSRLIFCFLFSIFLFLNFFQESNFSKTRFCQFCHDSRHVNLAKSSMQKRYVFSCHFYGNNSSTKHNSPRLYFSFFCWIFIQTRRFSAGVSMDVCEFASRVTQSELKESVINPNGSEKLALCSLLLLTILYLCFFCSSLSQQKRRKHAKWISTWAFLHPFVHCLVSCEESYNRIGSTRR